MPVRKSDKYQKRSYRPAGSNSLPVRTKTIEASALRSNEANSQDERSEATKIGNAIDARLGFERFEAGRKRVGWLCNMHSTTLPDDKIMGGRAAVDFYFLEEDGGSFKAAVEYDPYFLVAVRRSREAEVEEWIRRKFEGSVKNVRRIEKEDLSMPNHLLGYKRQFLELSFVNVNDLLAVRKVIMPVAEKNREKTTTMDAYAEVASAQAGFDIYEGVDMKDPRYRTNVDASDYITDIREYDVPYHVRVAIDKDVRIGKWYTVEAKHGHITLTCLEERLQRADPVVLAFDIETTKLPLKFPDSAFDQIMMISYMIDGAGFLITNRKIVSQDIADFEYTPKPEYPGVFTIFNEEDERAVLERFFTHVKECKPTVIATYNGDFFDWPFVEARASVHGIDMYQEIGFRRNSEDIYQSTNCVHMDCFSWVNRDSYLPQGSRGLKAVTTAKLSYDPDELDPELMTPYASQKPQVLAEYSVSDAVATYYLYMKYVHPFIFSLCTIIPLNPDDTLRKGTGTLCEMLLMVQAYQKNIVLPNKHKEPKESFWEGHLIESETYVGGHVESIEAGVFRSDIPTDFKIDTTAVDDLLRDLDAALQFSITIEEKKSMADVANYDEVKAEIVTKLQSLKDSPSRNEKPSIYHLDVASMYPNIMTTNRLQPDSMITEADCAACDFNRPGKTCDRRLPWAWRGEFLPAQKNEYNMIRHALESERFPGKFPKSPMRSFQALSPEEQAAAVKKRLQDYSKKIYHKVHDAKTIEREAIICQRENPFYVDTVRDFRDRRYDFKGKQKVWKNKTDALKASHAPGHEIDEAKKMIVLFDSLQLAHKVILNSFYGYVMRKGSRWYSMEMAGVTCLTGAHIIQMARELVERIGRPLELDTDGIWCMLPATFPENVTFTMTNGKKMTISYPCTMLNHLVHARFTNNQYQTLIDPQTFHYETKSDNSIFFEVDGPYRAMILPTSKEEDKNLKKRYAVFNHDGSLAELKGFEVKRRGELKLIKIFQTQIFKFFLEGTTLTETYDSVARVANQWLDVLEDKGSNLADEELIDLISENKSMTKTLEEYGAQKSTAITTAKRLAEFLGEQMTKDKGLNCKYIIGSRPYGAPVTDRAIPVAIFSSDDRTKSFYLRKWMGGDAGDMDPRTILDWGYYTERLGSVIQKLITIPAALQKIPNPVPRIVHPDWLAKRTRANNDHLKQRKLTDHMVKMPLRELDPNIMDHRVLSSATDLEDFGTMKVPKPTAVVSRPTAKRKSPPPAAAAEIDPYAALPSIMPDPSKNYREFLKYQKQKWKINKQLRTRRKQLFGENTGIGSDLGSHFKQKAMNLYTKTWQVLHLAQTESPGVIRAFILIDSTIHSVRIRVKRTVFLNLKTEDLPAVTIEGCEVEKVYHTLPNGHPSVHLFKLQIPEDVYVSAFEQVRSLFDHPSVEGIYETQVPLDIRAVLNLGSLCTFTEGQSGVLGAGLEHGFDLSNLHRVDAKQPYLQNSDIGCFFLYHVVTGERQIFAILSSRRTDAHIIVLSKAREPPSFPNVDKIYREALHRKQSEHADDLWQATIKYQDNINFTVTHTTSKKKAHLELSTRFKSLVKDSSNSMMVAIQSPQPQILQSEITLLADFPTFTIKFEHADSSLPSIGWQASVSRRIANHYLAVGAWTSHLTELARYGDVPLCNLQTDDPRFLIDIAYARRLQSNNIVLWWSDSPLPDHAGYEKDNINGLLERSPPQTLNNPGSYSSVCIELNLRNLAINTILSASLINDLEGSLPGHDEGDGNASGFQPSDAFASPGVAVLGEMVKAWWVEACKGSAMADVMVQHLIRWITSPASRLYDPLLKFYVETMSKKAFSHLLVEFRRVGSHIVYAHSDRIILQTTKTEVGNAYAYTQFILKSITAKPQYHFLDMQVKEYWDYLLWNDEFNYGGKACSEVIESQQQPLETIMNWQYATFLPHIYQPIFNAWVVEFIELMHSLKQGRRLNGEQVPRATQLPFKSMTKDNIHETDSEGSEALSSTLAKPLKRQIVALISRYRTEIANPILAPDHAYPELPGSSLDLENVHPVLQLVKTIFQVFSLNKALNLTVRAIRKDILTLFEIQEFSPAGRFDNPSASLVVPDWTCDECTLTRDLELCKDSSLTPTYNADKSELVQRTWQCPHCEAAYDKIAIEEHLIAEAQRLVMAWITQDLKCGKCGTIQSDNSIFMEHCVCAGNWVGTMELGGIKTTLKTMNTIASTFNMKMLTTVVEEMLSQC